jgi:hypothetical protein
MGTAWKRTTMYELVSKAEHTESISPIIGLEGAR